MSAIDRLKKRLLRWALPLPFEARGQEYSLLSSLDDDGGKPSARLLDLSLQAASRARTLDLSWISKRMPTGPFWPELWPGEHYRLLAALVEVLAPRRVVEIGTFKGYGALALTSSLPKGSEVVTVDVVPWRDFPDSALRASDFEGGRLRQVLADLSDPKVFGEFSEVLAGCDLLFVDAPKNVRFERAFLSNLETLRMPPGALVVFDDIRSWNMLRIWRELSRPKLDLTSFGHWTGTGLVEWSPP